MDYILIFNDYSRIYFQGKDVSVSKAKTKQQKITEFERTLTDMLNKAKDNFNKQIHSLTSQAYIDGHPDMTTLDRELQNSLRDQLRNFRDKQEQKSGLYD